MRDSLIGRRVLASRIGVFGVWRSREVLSVEHTAGRDIALMPRVGRSGRAVDPVRVFRWSRHRGFSRVVCRRAQSATM